jgi:hypothetical protein
VAGSSRCGAGHWLGLGCSGGQGPGGKGGACGCAPVSHSGGGQEKAQSGTGERKRKADERGPLARLGEGGEGGEAEAVMGCACWAGSWAVLARPRRLACW